MNRLVLAVVISVIAVVGIASVAQATFSGENGRIFYVVGAYTTSSTVMSACAGGTHVKPVVPLATYPSPSSDGTKISYNKLKVIGSSVANDGIWVANADGSKPVEITAGGLSPYSPTWSPDGTKLTFRQFVYYDEIKTSVMQPVVADVATKVITQLLSDKSYSIATEQTATNVWTPDGTQIFFPGTTGGSWGASTAWRQAAAPRRACSAPTANCRSRRGSTSHPTVSR
jgi:dipeptidyl aminopeptidase/acylaminoacyl peptidase